MQLLALPAPLRTPRAASAIEIISPPCDDADSMPSQHLAVALKTFLDSPGVKAVEIERKAGLPNASLAKMLQGIHPRSDKMEKLLGAVPPGVAGELLRAYLLDDCPEAWLDHLKIIVNGPGTADMEPGHAEQAETQSRLQRALDALNKTAHSDSATAEWLIQAAELMRLIPRA